MKIAIVTLFGYFNYGNRLQNYALQRVLEKAGGEVCTWNVSRDKHVVKRFFKKYIEKKNGKYGIRNKRERIREKNFKAFSDRYIKSRIFYSSDGRLPEGSDRDTDMFVVGSDQVWNPAFWCDSDESAEMYNYFLSFTKKKKIAYAASFGVDKISECWKRRISPLLSNFASISVREAEGKTILNELNYDACVVLDPTMLLTASEWKEIEQSSCDDCGDYILTYFLGHQPLEIIEQIQREAYGQGKTVIDLMDESSLYYCMGPETFVELIDKAAAVYTDSFHAVVFSLLFHTPFVVFQRNHTNNTNMSSRITTLLNLVGINDGISDNVFKLHSDFVTAEEKLKEARASALEFLNMAIEQE